MATRASFVCAVVVSMGLIASLGAAEPSREPDVIFLPTPPNVVEKMLELAKVTKDDLLYDLGCGDGRIPIAAAKKYGCKAVGYDIDPQRVKDSRRNVDANGVGNLVTIEQKDIFTLDLSNANVVTLYLLPSLNVKLIPQLEKLKPGSRIVSHDFDMKGVTPDQIVTVADAQDPDRTHRVYLWTTPLKKGSRVPDVLYVPTPQKVVEKMLELAKVSKKDVVCDLGCGDGRIPITAAKQYGCKAVGYDIDPRRVLESQKNVDANGVGRLVTIEQKDIFTLDLKGASVITLYLLPDLNVKLIPQLEKLKPGSR
ncbi:MAG: methyltransferase domain-containing protein, partial [Phycisphaerales bacterium]